MCNSFLDFFVWADIIEGGWKSHPLLFDLFLKEKQDQAYD